MLGFLVFMGLVCVLCVFVVVAHVGLARWSRESRVVVCECDRNGCVRCFAFGVKPDMCCANCRLGDPSPMAEYSECGCGCTSRCK